MRIFHLRFMDSLVRDLSTAEDLSAFIQRQTYIFIYTHLRVYIYIYINNCSRELSKRFQDLNSGKDFTPLKMWFQDDYNRLQYRIFSAFFSLGNVD